MTKFKVKKAQRIRCERLLNRRVISTVDVVGLIAMPQVNLAELVTQVQNNQALASFPTDTVPALAAMPEFAEQIFMAKQRSLEKPLILMGATTADLWGYITGSETEQRIWRQVADRYWPGALTLVLPASDRVPPVMNPKDPTTIGLRVPNHPLALAILRQTGPLATTSANRSGQPALQTMAEIEAQFPQVLTLSPKAIAELTASSHSEAILGGSGTPSTVMRWCKTGWHVLRQGTIQWDRSL